MASIERTAYPRLKKKFTNDELRRIYTPTTKELSFVYAQSRGSINVINLTLLLKVFQRLGYFPKLEDIPESLVSYIRDCLHIKKDTIPRYDHKRTLYRHHQAIREFLKVSPYSETNRKQIMKIIYNISIVKDNPADIINATIDEMIHSRMELPAFSTLDRLTKRVRMVVNRSYFQQILDRLSDIEQEKFDQILFKNENSDFSDFNRFKKLPKNPTLGNLKDLIDHLIWLQSFGDMKAYVQDVPIAKIKHFAAEAKSLKAKELRDYTKPKKITLEL
ncbi:DUF4158 domain-containing protein [Shimazuella sp. AN120528]|uniref:DUF4158 domain-containing protein n=1 Tax=Shimazuella soli TaxID=1892854 RepID=UPI001F104EE3|nr:DUF4158 domain-containing protein [Shimazuella soli]MCH5584879.1 DUF4158 domain-containing protein [Shimazuella soli]